MKLLRSDEAAIQRDLGFPVTFEELPNRIATRIVIRSDFDITQEGQWDRIFAWMLDKGEAFLRAFEKRVHDLQLTDPAIRGTLEDETLEADRQL